MTACQGKASQHNHPLLNIQFKNNLNTQWHLQLPNNPAPPKNTKKKAHQNHLGLAHHWLQLPKIARQSGGGDKKEIFISGESCSRKKEIGHKKKKTNPKYFYMQLVITKRQAEMIKARATGTKAKVTFMSDLKEMGLAFEEIIKMVDGEFPPIHDALADSNSEDSKSYEDSY
ncbi:hypothetical protein VP01_4644g2 [Puccinia sorghi]|uniref:Uncharacterized protein n=1 Tax=Puccinia sorghi TaxID=27349 RepID=A0A0L6UQ96_9BASI|nr:hypothetical protein VP01_4644g2 [Puccinia sorghi]